MEVRSLDEIKEKYLGYFASVWGKSPSKDGKDQFRGFIADTNTHTRNECLVLNPCINFYEYYDSHLRKISDTFNDGLNGIDGVVAQSKLIKGKGVKREFPIKDIDDIYVDWFSPINPKPEWLQKFEEFTNYEDDKMRVYFGGIKLAESNATMGIGIQNHLVRLRGEFYIRGKNLEDFYKEG